MSPFDAVANEAADRARILKQLESDVSLAFSAAARPPDDSEWFGFARGAYESAHAALVAQVSAVRDELMGAEMRLWRLADATPGTNGETPRGW